MSGGYARAVARRRMLGAYGMDWQKGERSQNVEIDSGRGGGGFGGGR
jgi:hypothetical protein